MKILITSGKKIPSRFILRKTNQCFSKNRNSGYLYSIIPVEEYGFIVSVKKREVSFEIYKEVENQEKKICDFLTMTFNNKTVGVRATGPCDWIKNIKNVRVINTQEG